jgi:pimeloyl-ACP methyl ester carboxylesterase
VQSNKGGTGSVSTVLVDSHHVGVWRFGSPGGWSLVWNHGGLSCGMDATVMDEAAQSCGAEIIAIDRPGIGRSDLWTMASVGRWGYTVGRVADLLHLDDFAVAGWSGGGPFALACAAAMPGRVRAVASIDGMAPLERLRHVFEIGFLPDELLIPAARWAPWAATALLQVIRRVPPRVLGWVLPYLAGSRDGAALDPPPQSLLATHREVMSGGVQGMVDEYRHYFGSWDFDLGEVHQPVTIWQGEEDTLVPMKHARRLASLLPNSTLRTVPATGHLLPVVMASQILDDLAPTS